MPGHLAGADPGEGVRVEHERHRLAAAVRRQRDVLTELVAQGEVGAAAPTAGPSEASASRRQSESVGVVLGQLPLEHLAGGVAGQLVEEHDLARHLVAGQVVLHPAP